MAAAQSRDTFRVGDLLNNTYRIDAVLGRGGTSEVYRARSEISGRLVALKVLKSELSANVDYLRLMTREEAIRDVRHDAVVRYSENHRTPEGHVYLIMDYVEGPTLDRLMRDGPVPAADLLVVARRVAEGLVAAHARRVVHRDLSPDNIILRDGRPGEAVIIDFGIAKDDSPGAETIVGNEFAGKYAYAAPEQLHGRTDARSDLYALGATLLACFRGAVPDLGANPVEMLRIKETAPDTAGVPEPLRGLIDRLCAPDPDRRFQTALEVVQALDPDFRAPGTARPTPLPPPDIAAPAAPSPAAGLPARRGRGGVVALAVVVVLVVALAGAYAAGLFGRLLAPALLVAAPYVLTVERAAGGPPAARGHVPTEEARQALAGRMAAAGGSADLTLASGAIAEGWGAAVAALVDRLAPLGDWRVEVTDNAAAVTGTAPDRATRDAVAAALAAPGPLAITADLAYGPALLAPDALRQALEAYQDCGPLVVQDPPAAGWPRGARIIVTGRMASEAGRSELLSALGPIIGEREATVDVEILNPQLCAIEAALPAAPSRGFQVIFGFGDRPDPNPAARYFVGENPVIDVVIPAEVTEGNLWVSLVDVTGSVFHLLPNLNRPDNSVAALRDGRTGAVPVRVAYSVAEATGTPKMAFLVDDSIMGKSKIVILHAPEQVFATLRPMSESVSGFAAALAGQEERDAMATLFSVDSRVLTTERP